MAYRGPPPQNPFANPQNTPYPQRQDYSDHDQEDPFNPMNSSTTRLAGAPYNENSSNEHDLNSRRYVHSVDSHSSIPSISPFADPGYASNEPYPAWSADRQIPMSTEEIEDIFLDLTQKFGFQRDSMRNMVSLTIYYVVLQSLTLPVRLSNASP